MNCCPASASGVCCADHQQHGPTGAGTNRTVQRRHPRHRTSTRGDGCEHVRRDSLFRVCRSVSPQRGRLRIHCGCVVHRDNGAVMSELMDETFEFEVAGQTRRAQECTPPRLAVHPGLLIALGGDRTWPFTSPDGIWISAGAFLAAGHRVVSFDLPYHGERADHMGEGLTGMAAAAAAGIDVFDDIRQTGKVLIDFCLVRGLAGRGGIAIEGTSRGGLAVAPRHGGGSTRRRLCDPCARDLPARPAGVRRSG